MNIADLVLVAGKIGTGGSVSPVLPEVLQLFTIDDIQHWITQAKDLPLTDEISKRGMLLLERLLAISTPKETMLMANYPNPFNPETWIPYQLAHSSDVQIVIYDTRGTAIRHFTLGHQPAGYYTTRARAAYWDGRNGLGERVATGVYFYQLQADDASFLRKMVILK